MSGPIRRDVMARDRYLPVLVVFHGLSNVQLRGKIDFLYSYNKLTSDVISWAGRPPCEQNGKCQTFNFTSNGAQSNPYSVTVPKVPDIHFAERAFFFGSWLIAITIVVSSQEQRRRHAWVIRNTVLDTLDIPIRWACWSGLR